MPPPRNLLRRFSALELLLALIVLIGAFPFVERLNIGSFIISVLFTLVLSSALLAIEERRRVLMVAALIALPTLTCRWINQFRPDLVPAELFLIGGMAFLLFVVVSLLRFILRAQSVTSDVLCTAISAYLMLGLLWTMAYWLIAELIPNAFAFNATSARDHSMHGFNSLYFSFITLSTVGYGDITPVASSVRLLAAAEAVTGLLYIGVLIARLVAIHSIPKTN